MEQLELTNNPATNRKSIPRVPGGVRHITRRLSPRFSLGGHLEKRTRLRCDLGLCDSFFDMELTSYAKGDPHPHRRAPAVFSPTLRRHVPWRSRLDLHDSCARGRLDGRRRSQHVCTVIGCKGRRRSPGSALLYLKMRLRGSPWTEDIDSGHRGEVRNVKFSSTSPAHPSSSKTPSESGERGAFWPARSDAIGQASSAVFGRDDRIILVAKTVHCSPKSCSFPAASAGGERLGTRTLLM